MCEDAHYAPHPIYTLDTPTLGRDVHLSSGRSHATEEGSHELQHAKKVTDSVQHLVLFAPLKHGYTCINWITSLH